MKKIAALKKVLALSILLILVAVQYLFMQDYYISSDIISSLIVFLSTAFGFYIASLAIFATSSYVAGLYEITDSQNRNRTLLHALVENYRFGLVSILTSVLYFLVIQFLVQLSNNQLSLGTIVALPLVFVILFNFYHIFKMLNDLINVIVQQAKDNRTR